MDAIIFVLAAIYFAYKLESDRQENENISDLEVRMNTNYVRHDDAFKEMYKELIK